MGVAAMAAAEVAAAVAAAAAAAAASVKKPKRSSGIIWLFTYHVKPPLVPMCQATPTLA